MAVRVQEEGDYELFETTEGHRILNLKGELWYAWVEGQLGEILVKSDADHERRRTLQQGHFYTVDFEGDPEFRDMPHLFLEKEGRYQELILPNGLPTEQNNQKKIIATDTTLDEGELEDHIHRATASERGGRKQGLPFEDYETLTVDEITGRLDALSREEIARLRHYEETHKNRKTLRRTLDRRLRASD